MHTYVQQCSAGLHSMDDGRTRASARMLYVMKVNGNAQPLVPSAMPSSAAVLVLACRKHVMIRLGWSLTEQALSYQSLSYQAL